MLRIQECLEDTAPFLQLLHCFLPSPFCVSWALQGDTDAPLKAGYSTTTYSLHFDHLWTSALTSTNYKFLSPKLTVALNYKHKQNILKNVWTRDNSSRLPIMAYELPSHRPLTRFTAQGMESFLPWVGYLRNTHATIAPVKTSYLEKSLNFALFGIPKCSESLDGTLSL